MGELDFITDKSLRETLENSIEFIYVLNERSKDSNQKKIYQEETYRIIILYVISAIEAVLLYFFKDRGEKFEYPDYKFTIALPPEFEHKAKSGLPLVIAVQEKKEKQDYQIGLHDLVIFFRNKNLIIEKTANEILDLNDVRNSFHFSKPRAKSCDLKRVESALGLLVYTLERAPKALRKIADSR